MHIKPKYSLVTFRRTLGGWIIPLLLTLGMTVVFASFAKDTSAAPSAQNAIPTTTPMPGMQQNPSSVPANSQTASDLDALLLQMQQTMQTLQGMMGQLGQQNVFLPATTPTAAPKANLPAIRADLQEIEQALVPLIKRIQADLQGNPSAKEIASVRAEVNLFQIRLAYLMNHLQIARGGSAVATATPTMASMPDLATISPTAAPQTDLQQTQAMINKLDLLLQQTQSMLQQLQMQQAVAPSGSTPLGQMNGMNMSTPTVSPTVGPITTTNVMPETKNTPQAQPTPMAGMSGANVSMDTLMASMDNMMAMMDSMMGNMSGQMSGINMPSASPTPTPAGMSGISGSNPSMNNIMDMMDSMMQMMDNLMQMIDD